MNSTSPAPRDVSTAARSPARSMAGPLVVRICAPISAATMFASVVLPRPGGPYRRMWSTGSPRFCAASMRIARFSLIRSWPANSSSLPRPNGRLERELLLGDLGARDALDRHRCARAARIEHVSDSTLGPGAPRRPTRAPCRGAPPTPPRSISAQRVTRPNVLCAVACDEHVDDGHRVADRRRRATASRDRRSRAAA